MWKQHGLKGLLVKGSPFRAAKMLEHRVAGATATGRAVSQQRSIDIVHNVLTPAQCAVFEKETAAISVSAESCEGDSEGASWDPYADIEHGTSSWAILNGLLNVALKSHPEARRVDTKGVKMRLVVSKRRTRNVSFQNRGSMDWVSLGLIGRSDMHDCSFVIAA